MAKQRKKSPARPSRPRRRASAVIRSAKQVARSDDSGIGRDERGQVQPKDKSTAQR